MSVVIIEGRRIRAKNLDSGIVHKTFEHAIYCAQDGLRVYCCDSSADINKYELTKDDITCKNCIVGKIGG